MVRFLLLALALTGCGVSQELYDQRTTELDRCRTDLTRSQGEVATARARAEARAEVYRNLEQKLKGMIDAHTLAVEFRKGRMMVKLPDQILFDPGKAEL